ncbi:biotin transporter BioY [Anaerotignum lactatifermentans]|uniref:Biotin transporter n=1 Tax=Anaerotignum lactatifermentans TaxID=160404 RepID=A0ABS2G927_9FIRM|nr:biotin transporter BioY [Anaerotignum lactatifermentans]MBM6828407.1 biotin transporter BioY [Anaerotignum lactatifermentans]MBM6877687.1 biotin transporter BioY [Anaerotignum lactatifermentans]MBM6949990.1 biotin transporter BioY [Anaerotignum lactatifermentans]
MRREKTKDMMLCGLFVALISVGAFMKVPVPVVPFTLQFLFTMLAGLLLGPGKGAGTVGIYILLGLLGLPVFSQGGGIGYIFQPTFGYLLGFAAGAYVTGVIAWRRQQVTYQHLLAANFAGLVVVYGFGMLYYYLMSNFYLGNSIGLWPLFLYCFVLAVPGDIALCILGAVLAKRLLPIVRRGGLLC